MKRKLGLKKVPKNDEKADKQKKKDRGKVGWGKK
jgi:hypothetical protein